MSPRFRAIYHPKLTDDERQRLIAEAIVTRIEAIVEKS
jgi:hypothetical protein